MVGITGGVTFTLDLEDHRPANAPPGNERYPQLTRRVLDFLDARGARGTFFVVGEIAEQQAELVREVATRGHEVGLHAGTTLLTELDDRRCEMAARGLLGQVGEAPVPGFRAPRSRSSGLRAGRWTCSPTSASRRSCCGRNPRFGGRRSITPLLAEGVVSSRLRRVGTIRLLWWRLSARTLPVSRRRLPSQARRLPLVVPIRTTSTGRPYWARVSYLGGRLSGTAGGHVLEVDAALPAASLRRSASAWPPRLRAVAP
jgi:peptidoglycan/xylan/chitin deacetylase (PgdA/CDA1 family)